MGLLIGFQAMLAPYPLFLIAIGTLLGIICGAIPGFTVTLGVVLALPFTFGMDPINGFALMIGVFIGGFSGGLISGILLGIPGTPASICTTFDGHPMAKNGEAGRALGLGVISSFFGTVISAVVLTTIGPIVARQSLKFGPWEITALVVFALSLIASLSDRSTLKGLIAGCLGLLLATVGIDTFGMVRFSFGVSALTTGFHMLTVLIGLFAFSQLLKSFEQLKRQQETGELAEYKHLKIPYKKILTDLKNQWFNVIRSSLIGTFIGALPAAGGDVANFVSYDQAKKMSKYPHKFGTGVPDGVIAAECANNGTAGGAFIPTLALGIPGDMPQAVMMGALILHGITPGPLLFQQQPRLVFSIYAACFIAAFFIIFWQFLCTRVFFRLSRVPQEYLAPVVLMLCSVGVFSLDNRVFDMWVLWIFGIVGYLMDKAEVPLAPIILGFILGPKMEAEFIRAWELSPSLTPFITRPISAFFIAGAVISVIVSYYQAHKLRKREMQYQMSEKKDFQGEIQGNM